MDNSLASLMDADFYAKRRREQMAREMSHRSSGYIPTREEISQSIDVGLGRLPADIAYGEKGLQAPTVAGGMVSLDPTDYLSGSGLAKLAAMAKVGGLGLASLASGMTAMNRMGAQSVPRLFGQSGALAKPKIYHRFTSTPTPDTGAGYMMFADDAERVSRSYGKNYWQATTEGTKSEEINKLLPDIKKAIEDHRLADEYRTSSEMLTNEFSPDDVVNSAGAWDNPELVQFIYDKVLEPKGIESVVLPDGAIFFNQSHVRKAKY